MLTCRPTSGSASDECVYRHREGRNHRILVHSCFAAAFHLREHNAQRWTAAILHLRDCGHKRTINSTEVRQTLSNSSGIGNPSKCRSRTWLRWTSVIFLPMRRRRPALARQTENVVIHSSQSGRSAFAIDQNASEVDMKSSTQGAKDHSISSVTFTTGVCPCPAQLCSFRPNISVGKLARRS